MFFLSSLFNNNFEERNVTMRLADAELDLGEFVEER